MSSRLVWAIWQGSVFFSLVFYFELCVCVCGYVWKCACECGYLKRLEGLYPLELGVEITGKQTGILWKSS